MTTMMRPRDLCTAAFYNDVQRMKQLIRAALPNQDEEDEEEFSPVADNDQDEEMEVEEEQLFIQRLERKRKRRELVATLLSKTGLLHTVETGEEYGFLFRVEEQMIENKINVQFKVSKRSRYPAAPLHWAVMGRSHHAVEFLVSSGVNVMQEVPDFPKVTPAIICKCNKSLETAQRLEKAFEAYKQRLQNEENQKCQWVKTLDAKKEERERQAEFEKQGEEEDEENSEKNEELGEEEQVDDEGDDDNNNDSNAGTQDYEDEEDMEKDV